MVRRYIESLTYEHQPLISDFFVVESDNRNDYFKNYLMYNGMLDNEQGIAKTKVYIEEDDDGQKKIVGFYAIRASSLIIDTLGVEKKGEPALEVFELAVHKDYQGQGIGKEMLMDIFATAHHLNETYLGIKHLVVCAKASAKKYYEREPFNFREMPNYKIPRNDSNEDCIGMSVRLQFK